MSTVRVIDCTLREGDQSAGVWLQREDKLALFALLDDAGVDVVDAGMPVVSQDEQQLLRELSALPGRRAAVGASARCLPEEVELSADCGVDEVFLIFPVSAIHRTERLGLTPDVWRELGRAAMQTAARRSLAVDLVLEDASRADQKSLEDALQLAREGGAKRVMVCDTVGVLTPARAAELITWIMRLAGDDLEVGTHFHNDFGMATANTVAAVEAGARWPSVTVNGIGERAGNAVLAEVVVATQDLLGLDCSVDRRALVTLAREVERRSGLLLAADAPIVGARAFTHESGIHVDGVLKNPRNYEAIDPATLGRERSFMVGKHTGKAGLVEFAKKRSLTGDEPMLEGVLERFKNKRPAAYQQRIDAFMQQRNEFLAGSQNDNDAALQRLFDKS